MDNLTSLSSTLPHNHSSQSEHNAAPRPADDDSPPLVLLSDFKQAARSITALYKNANAELERSRKLGHQEGYQGCLDDLLELLANNHIQQNSEVRKIREWVLSKQRSKFGGPRRSSDPADDSEDEKARMPSNSPASPIHSEPQLAPLQDSYRPAPVPLSPMLSNPAIIPPATTPQQPMSVHKESWPGFSFRSYRLPQHPPPPPIVPMAEDTDAVDVDVGSPTPMTQQQAGFFSPHSRAVSGAAKRRYPYNEFLELAATAERERDWVTKRGRLG